VVTYVNDIGVAADGLHIIAYWPGGIVLVQNAPGCSSPSIHTSLLLPFVGWYLTDVIWPAPCVDPGESVTIEWFGDCITCHVFFEPATWTTSTPTPTPDSDGDGVFDPQDACPTTQGLTERQGCPVGDANLVELHVIDQQNAGACPGGAGSCKSPIASAEVRVFDRNDPVFQAAYGTKNPAGGIYNQVFENDIGRVGACTTGSDGRCTAGEETTGDYLAVVKYVDPSGQTVYTGKPKSPEDFDATGLASKEFQAIKVLRRDGSLQFSGGSKTVVTGSYLEIVYPDFAIWEDPAQGYVYPFIFTSDSEWTVDVCAQVPAGYNIVGVYDQYGSLLTGVQCVQTFVAGQTKVVAFEVVEVGSPEPTLTAQLVVGHPGTEKEAVDVEIEGVRLPPQAAASEGPRLLLILGPALVGLLLAAASVTAVLRLRRRPRA